MYSTQKEFWHDVKRLAEEPCDLEETITSDLNDNLDLDFQGHLGSLSQAGHLSHAAAELTRSASRVSAHQNDLMDFSSKNAKFAQDLNLQNFKYRLPIDNGRIGGNNIRLRGEGLKHEFERQRCSNNKLIARHRSSQNGRSKVRQHQHLSLRDQFTPVLAIPNGRNTTNLIEIPHGMIYVPEDVQTPPADNRIVIKQAHDSDVVIPVDSNSKFIEAANQPQSQNQLQPKPPQPSNKMQPLRKLAMQLPRRIEYSDTSSGMRLLAKAVVHSSKMSVNSRGEPNTRTTLSAPPLSSNRAPRVPEIPQATPTVQTVCTNSDGQIENQVIWQETSLLNCRVNDVLNPHYSELAASDQEHKPRRIIFAVS